MWTMKIAFIIMVFIFHLLQLCYSVHDEYIIDPSTVVVCSYFFSSKIQKRIQGPLKAILSNHAEYAQKHGYTYRTFDFAEALALGLEKKERRDRKWAKLLFFSSLFDQGFKWILYIDTDAIFFDTSLSISQSLNRIQSLHGAGTTAFNIDKKDMYFSGDTLPINSGFILIQNTVWMRRLLDTAYSIGPYAKLPTYEQGAIVAVLNGCTALSSIEELWECYNHAVSECIFFLFSLSFLLTLFSNEYSPSFLSLYFIRTKAMLKIKHIKRR